MCIRRFKHITCEKCLPCYNGSLKFETKSQSNCVLLLARSFLTLMDPWESSLPGTVIPGPSYIPFLKNGAGRADKNLLIYSFQWGKLTRDRWSHRGETEAKAPAVTCQHSRHATHWRCLISNISPIVSKTVTKTIHISCNQHNAYPDLTMYLNVGSPKPS